MTNGYNQRYSGRRDDFRSIALSAVSHAGSLTIAAKEGPEPHRHSRWPPRAHAPQDACNEPGKAGCRTRPHLPAGAKIREWQKPHRGQPVAANLPYSSGASSVVLRGCAYRISATRLRWKRVIGEPD